MGKSSGGRGKKREVKGREKGRSKIAVSAARARGRGRGRGRGSGQGKVNHYFYFFVDTMNKFCLGGQKANQKFPSGILQRNMRCHTLPCRKELQGTVKTMVPSSGGGKGNPHILSKSVEGKKNKLSLFAHFFHFKTEPSNY